MTDHNYLSLQKLWESLQKLFLNISHELHHRQLSKSKMSNPKGKMDIWGKLGDHIEGLPAPDGKDHFQQSAEPELSFQKNEHFHNPDKESVKDSGSLGQYYQNNIDENLHPHVSDQMQRSAMDHINMSFYLARKGDKIGAKLHVELAESAVHTASRFMTEEQYRHFEKNMMTKIESAIDFVNPDLEVEKPK